MLGPELEENGNFLLNFVASERGNAEIQTHANVFLRCQETWMFYNQQLLGALVKAPNLRFVTIPSSCTITTLKDLTTSNSISSIIVRYPEGCHPGFGLGLVVYDIARHCPDLEHLVSIQPRNM